ncbi:hypothetical protein M378DRAFT_167854 [Amanita muscaria Koide BX008]|uniref:Uncharacterized protein n=1 Tax=Amanita muscaria (strain Koide BX008) TaxID=946122 RepID=A0A0C2WW98_AMAMK|nr:hypothetical protein M378DRAFT_167854 [Amanita muscaria Koide BX008]
MTLTSSCTSIECSIQGSFTASISEMPSFPPTLNDIFTAFDSKYTSKRNHSPAIFIHNITNFISIGIATDDDDDTGSTPA